MNMKSAAAAVSLFLSLLLPLGVAAAKDASKQATPPNIIVIMTDDQRDVDPLERMPNVQALMVGQGVRFVNSFAVNPVCCASRASFLTGQYSHNDGIWDNKSGPRPGGFKDFKGDDNTIACWTQAAGYRTALIGKYLNGYGKGKAAKYIPPCWNYWWGLTHPFRYYDYEANDNGTVRVYGKRDSDYQEDVVSGLAQQFITQSKQPFFLWITGIAPHAGYPAVNVPVPPKRYKDTFKNLKLPRPPNFNEAGFADKPRFLRRHMPLMDKASVDLARQSYRRRAETVLAADDMVGAIIGLLQSKGMLANTYIVFTSDNGYFNGEHRIPVGKHLLYEESLRVPLVIRGPGIPAGQTRAEMVSNLDLSATVVQLAGATPGRTLDGRSLAPLFAGDQPWRTAMLMEGADVLPLGGDETVYGYYSAVRSADYIYAEHVNRQEKYVGAEFYDLGADPYQLESRPDDPKYQQLIAQLKPMLANLRGCSGDSCWIGDALAKAPPQRTVKPDIGSVCTVRCGHLDLKHPLERAEAPDVR
jgi:arylsulfatase A-like enzyme